MNRIQLHHQNKNELGLLPDRLVYDEKKVSHRFQDIETSEPVIQESKEARKKADEIIRQIEKNKEEGSREIDDYNKEFAFENKCFLKRMFSSPETYEKKLVAAFDNVRLFTRMINEVLYAKHEYNGVTYTVETSPDPERKKQTAILVGLKKRISDHITFTRQHEQKETESIRGSRYRLSRRMRQVTKMIDDKSVIQERQEYKDLLGDYNQVFSTLIKDPAYKRFYSRVELNDTVDPVLQRENRQLFFAILHKETNGFKTDFILSKFKNGDTEADIEENKKNYPFIYNEWLKSKGVKLDDVEKANQDATDKEAQMLASRIPVGEDLASRLNSKITNPKVLSKVGKFNKIFDQGKLNSLSTDGKGVAYYNYRISALEQFSKTVNLAIGNLNHSDEDEYNFFIDVQDRVVGKEIKANIELEKLRKNYAIQNEKIKKVDKKFTKANFSRPSMRQTVLELAMRKFHTAIAKIDSPLSPKNVSWHLNLHKGIRRLLIATTYQRGVGRYNPDTKKYVENPSGEHSWLLAELVQSPYFNPTVKDKYLDSEQREMLIIGTYSNLALFKMKRIDEVLNGLKVKEKKTLARVKKLLDMKNGGGINNAQQEQLDKDIKRLNRYTKRSINEGNVLTITEDETKRLTPIKKQWEELYTETEKLLSNPDRQKIRNYIEKLKKSKLLGEGSMTNKDIIEDYAKFIEGVDLTYNMFELKEKSTGNVLERMGINPEGIYEAYVRYSAKHKDMNVEQWDKLFTTKEGTKKLADMFRAILTNSKTYQGKDDFINVFETLNAQKTTDPKMRDDKVAAFNIFKRIKLEVTQRKNVAATSRSKHKEALEKQDGMTFGDRISDYAKKIFNMVVGPNQSIANRAAGVALMYAAYKIAEKAIKGKGATATGLRILFMAGATELALKQFFGEGLTDKLRLMGLSNALKDTYEDVLLDKGNERFKTLNYNGENVSNTDHSRALIELKRSNVPFSKVIDWYRSTEPDGSPRKGVKKVRPPIDVTAIAPGKMRKNQEGFGKFVLRETIRNFFSYVANKEKRAGGDPDTGMNILDEVWVKPVKDKNFNLNKAQYADRQLPSFLLKDLRRRPKSVTWQMVMWSEIRQSDIEEAKQKRIEQQASAYFKKGYNEVSKLTREDIFQPAGAAARVFWKDVGDRYKPGMQKFLEDVWKSGERRVQWGTNEVTTWYNGNKATLRQVAGVHWELVTEGAKSIFLAVHRVGSFAVPLAAQKIKQFNELLRSDQIDIINHDLGSDDVMDKYTIGPKPTDPGAGATDKQKHDYRVALAEWNTKKTTESQDAMQQYFKGSKWKNFGLYGLAFEKAASKTTDKFYETKEGDTDKYGNKMSLPKGIGYFISETTQRDAGIDPRRDKDMGFQLNKMDEKASLQAIKRFKDEYPQLTEAQIKKYMYPVHVMVKKSKKGIEKIYTFWRMPLPGSTEFDLQKAGRFSDYTNPNYRKHRPLSIIDKSKGVMENVNTLLGPTNPTLRGATDKATALFIAQGLRAFMTLGEAGGFMLGKPLSYVLPAEGTFIREIMGFSEKRRQMLDEMLGSAGNPALALSNFYKDGDNSKIYQNLFEYAAARGQKLRLDYKKGEIPEYAMKDTTSPTSRSWKKVKYTRLDHTKNKAEDDYTDERLNPNLYKGK